MVEAKLAKIYIAETKTVSPSMAAERQEKGGLKIPDSPRMFMKTKETSSDILTNATMLMKKIILLPRTHDVDENKGIRGLVRAEESGRWRARRPDRYYDFLIIPASRIPTGSAA